VTLPLAQEYYRKRLFYSQHQIYFLDHEALFLWGEYYINQMAWRMDFPVDTDRCLTLLDHNPNKKYVTPVDDHWLDAEIRAGRRPFRDRLPVRLRDNPESP